MTAAHRYNEWRFEGEEGQLAVVSCESMLSLDIERIEADGQTTEGHYRYAQVTNQPTEQDGMTFATGPESWALTVVFCADPEASHHARLLVELGSAIYTGHRLIAMGEWQVSTQAAK